MEYDIDFSHMPDYLVITTRGNASVEGFSALLKELTESPQWLPGTKQLIDHRQLELSHFTPDDMVKVQSLVQLFAHKLGHGKCAFVMEGIAGFLTGEFYTTSSNLPHAAARNFSQMDTAITWLLQDEA